MEPFIVSALKYRPQQFKDVVGQSAITETLNNAILKNQLPQALLFCGSRGVGKTTCARILAKRINSSDQTILILIKILLSIFLSLMLPQIILLMISVTSMIKFVFLLRLERIRFTSLMKYICCLQQPLMHFLKLLKNPQNTLFLFWLPLRSIK